MQVCKEAEITEIAVQSQEMPATDYLTVVQKDMTGDFTTKLPDKKSWLLMFMLYVKWYESLCGGQRAAIKAVRTRFLMHVPSRPAGCACMTMTIVIAMIAFS